MINFVELLALEPKIPAVAPLRTIDKNGRFYHLVQRASNKENIYDKELAKYRENLLCRISSMYDVTILFSVVLRNHSHDVFMTENWEFISKAIKQVNSAISKKVREKHPQKYINGRRVFESKPYYRALHDIVDLHVVAKYTYDNVAKVEEKGGYVPYSCFWTMEKGFLSKPYNKLIYPALFDMTEIELCNLFKENDITTVRKLAQNRFKNWTQLDNDRLFKADINVHWLDLART